MIHESSTSDIFIFKKSTQKLRDFFLIVCHTKPGGGLTTENEIDELVNVYENAMKKFGISSCK